MKEYFHTGTGVSHLWLQKLSSNSWQDIAVLCAVIAAICLVKYVLATILFFLYNSPKWHHKGELSLARRLIYHILASIITMMHVVLGYLLMLAFMSYNAWLCIAIILGSGLFFYLTAWSHTYLSQLYTQAAGEVIPSEDSSSPAVGSGKIADSVALPEDPTKDRKSADAAQLLSMSTFQRNQMLQLEEPEEDTSADASTLLIRPDLLAQESDDGAGYKGRSDSDPLLDKYPVLRFHNVDVKDTKPVPDRKSKALEFDELDQLIKELGDA